MHKQRPESRLECLEKHCVSGTERYVCAGGVHPCVHTCVVAPCPYRYQQRARRGFAELNLGSSTVRTNKVSRVAPTEGDALATRPLCCFLRAHFLCQLESRPLMYERSPGDPLPSGTRPLRLISQIHDSSTYCLATRQRFITGFFLLSACCGGGAWCALF